jgi:hypothetical protein
MLLLTSFLILRRKERIRRFSYPPDTLRCPVENEQALSAMHLNLQSIGRGIRDFWAGYL